MAREPARALELRHPHRAVEAQVDVVPQPHDHALPRLRLAQLPQRHDPDPRVGGEPAEERVVGGVREVALDDREEEPSRAHRRRIGSAVVSIAVVVLTHDRAHLLRQCVENVLGRASELTTEIVIWNNGSTDGTAEYLDTLDDPRIRVVHHPENIGQNAYAEAFRLTSAPYMLELDDDMIDAPSAWDRSLLEAFDRLPEVGFLAANLVDNPHDQAARVMYHERPHLYSTVVENGIPLVRGPVGGGCALTLAGAPRPVSAASASSGPRSSGSRTRPTSPTSRSSATRAAYLRDVQLLHAGGSYYAEMRREARVLAPVLAREVREPVKRPLLRIPFVRPLNDRLRLFTPPS